MFRIWYRHPGKSRLHLLRFSKPWTRAKPDRGHLPVLETLEDRTLPSFLPAVNYDVGRQPYAVTSADLTGTGILDLVTTNSLAGTVSVLLGKGDGTFQAHVDYPVGTNPKAVDVADLTGNGILDIVVANDTSNGTVSVLLGNGDGTFQPAQTFNAGVLPTDVAVADLNADGIPDLVTADGSNEVNVLLGNGDGTFQAPVAYAAGSSPRSVSVADLNGDGIPDLAVADEAGLGGTPGVSILLGNGDGTFQAPVVYAVTGFPQYLEVGDFHGNGIPDLATLNLESPGASSTVSIFQGNGDGTFQSPVNSSVGSGETYGMTVGDFNGDGILDVAVTELNVFAGRVDVLLGNGDGTLQKPQSYSTGSNSVGVTAGDFNGDGWTDLAVTNVGDDTVSVLLNSGDGLGPSQDRGAGLETKALAGAERDVAVASGQVGRQTESASLRQPTAIEALEPGLPNGERLFTSQDSPTATGRPDTAQTSVTRSTLTGRTTVLSSAAETLGMDSRNTEITDLAFVLPGLVLRPA